MAEHSGIDLFNLLTESYKIYPASSVETSREIAIGRIDDAIWGRCYITVRIELSNRQTYMNQVTWSELEMAHLEVASHGLQILEGKLTDLLNKTRVGIEAAMDRTNKEPWT
jgi:hypothetical protein